MIELLIALIKRFEGFRSLPYRCPAGVWTIGYGVTGPGIGPNHPPVTRAVAEDMLKRILPRYILSQKYNVSYARRAAVSDWMYNLGAVRFRASTFRKKILAGDWEAAAHECRKWAYGGGVKLPGLVKRREAEAQLILRG